MPLKKTSFITVLLILLVFTSAYFKEVFFEIVNAMLAGYDYNYANTKVPKWLLLQPHRQLIQWKWIVLITNIFIINTINLIYLKLNKNTLLFKVYLIFLILILTCMALSFVIFKFTDNELFMTVSRVFQMIIESPLIILLLILIQKFPDFFFKKQL